MRKALISTTILCTAICIGVHSQTNKVEEPIITPEPMQVEVTTTSTPMPDPDKEITVPESEEPVSKVIEPTPAPEPAIQQPATNESVQAGDMVYVPGFGWIESQGEGTVTYDENIYENGNKVGIMG